MDSLTEKEESFPLVDGVDKQASRYLTEEERLKRPSFWQRVAPIKGK